MTSVWCITGASNGIGKVLALRVLEAGHQVIAAMRNPSKSADAVEEVEKAGGKVLQLDMTESQDGIAKKMKVAESIFGRIDILVNNAGYSLLGPLENFSESETNTLFQTNVYGPLYATQAVLPAMRARRSGTIINVSSVAGLDAGPSCSLYASSKFALEGYTEALAKEVEEFGITVLIVEPGAFRTNFLNAMVFCEKGVGEAYESGPVGRALSAFQAASGQQPGDPQKAADSILDFATRQGAAGSLNGQVLRLVLGQDAQKRIKKKIEKLSGDLEAASSVTVATDIST